MKFVVLAALVAGAFCAEVVELTESTFDAKLKNEDIALVGQCAIAFASFGVCSLRLPYAALDLRVFCALV